MNQKRKCPSCQSGTMSRDKRPFDLKRNGISYIVELDGWYCNKCGEGIHIGDDMEPIDKLLKTINSK